MRHLGRERDGRSNLDHPGAQLPRHHHKIGDTPPLIIRLPPAVLAITGMIAGAAIFAAGAFAFSSGSSDAEHRSNSDMIVETQR
jgi:hypothetical protein